MDIGVASENTRNDTLLVEEIPCYQAVLNIRTAFEAWLVSLARQNGGTLNKEGLRIVMKKLQSKEGRGLMNQIATMARNGCNNISLPSKQIQTAALGQCHALKEEMLSVLSAGFSTRLQRVGQMDVVIIRDAITQVWGNTAVEVGMSTEEICQDRYTACSEIIKSLESYDHIFSSLMSHLIVTANPNMDTKLLNNIGVVSVKAILQSICMSEIRIVLDQFIDQIKASATTNNFDKDDISWDKLFDHPEVRLIKQKLLDSIEKALLESFSDYMTQKKIFIITAKNALLKLGASPKEYQFSEKDFHAIMKVFFGKYLGNSNILRKTNQLGMFLHMWIQDHYGSVTAHSSTMGNVR